MSDTRQTELEAAFRRLVEHLRERDDVQNIDLMIGRSRSGGRIAPRVLGLLGFRASDPMLTHQG